MNAGANGSGKAKPIKRGPRGGRKHRPAKDHRNKQTKKSMEKKWVRRKAARKKQEELEQEKMEEYWRSLSPEQRRLLENVKGVDPNA